jgi:uncharacterized protein (DUF488 family)
MEIYTIGHSNAELSDFLSLLCRYEIQTLVDARSQPYSRYSPHFSRDPLRRSISDAGIEYVFLGDLLGGRPEGEEFYTGGKADYDAIENAPFYIEGIERLLEIAARRRAALMCSEADFKKCHRYNLITRTLARRGIDVFHILHTGDLATTDKSAFEPRQLSLF